MPVFSKSKGTERILTYYYEKLKQYYKNIKRKLNITVEDSGSSDSDSYLSDSENNLSTKEELLKDIKSEIEEDQKKKTVAGISSYKTESKALEELVSYLKLNPKFEQVKTLKTEDCFEEQSIFEETVSKR